MNDRQSRETDVGKTCRAVAMHLNSSVIPTRVLPSSGVPGIGTRALTGKDSGASGNLTSGMNQSSRQIGYYGTNALTHFPN